MSEFHVVVNDCAAPPIFGGPISIRTRETQHGPRNFLLKFDELAKGLPDRLSPRQMDWLETIGHLYAIDLACRRGGGDLGWSRSIDAWLPVRDEDYWRSQVAPLQSIFTSFTSDRVAITFVGDTTPSDPPRQSRSPFPQHDSVSLLSGGMDSFVGTAELIRQGRKPLLLSHIAGGAINQAQDALENTLRMSHLELKRVTLSARKSGADFPYPEPSQRSRTFLFLAAALTIAAASDSRSVFINENGVMAIHLPMTAARIGSLSTHTAAPSILNRIANLATTVLGTSLSIANNLLQLTKPDVVDVGVSAGYRNQLIETVSCWSIGRTRQHCGVCAPCLMRRISCEIHGVSDVAYQADAFEDSTVLDGEFACDNLTHLVSLVDELNLKSDLELQIAYPELLNGGSNMDLAKAVALHRRWAAQASAVLFEHSVPQMVRI